MQIEHDREFFHEQPTRLWICISGYIVNMVRVWMDHAMPNETLMIFHFEMLSRMRYIDVCDFVVLDVFLISDSLSLLEF